MVKENKEKIKGGSELMEKIVSLCKRRGFIFPGSEIYGGMANSWDYGPLGVELKNNIKKQGIDSLHIVSDFDRTLTYASVGGEKIPSIISILRDGNYLSKEYAEKAHALFNKYHSIEIDNNIKNG